MELQDLAPGAYSSGDPMRRASDEGEGQARRRVELCSEPAAGVFLKCLGRQLESLWIVVFRQNVDVFEKVAARNLGREVSRRTRAGYFFRNNPESIFAMISSCRVMSACTLASRSPVRLATSRIGRHSCTDPRAMTKKLRRSF